MDAGKRIALGGILTECNHFGGLPITIDWFERYELLRGEEILQSEAGVVGGMLQVLHPESVRVVPLLYASTCPGGPLTAACYTQLKDELVERLRQILPVDGVLLPLHGAAAADNAGDLEGDLIQTVRALVGPEVPIVGTLDLHAHVSSDMVQGADALLAWETYPHRDALGTGQRAARLMLEILAQRCRPTMAMVKVPLLTSALRGSTEGDDPFAHFMRATKALESRDDVLSTSGFMVHPNLDLPGLGGGALVITNDDLDEAVALATERARHYWDLRFELEGEAHTPAEAIAEGLEIEGGPVVLVETADCCGGGAAGDSVATLRALIEQGAQWPTLTMVVDPQAAAACQRAGVGSEVTLSLGHHQDPRWGQPLEVQGRVERLSDGKFVYTGGMWNGVEGDMGPSAVLTIGAVQVLVMSHPTYDWADEQYRAVQLDPAAAKFVVAKNPMNYRMAYGAVAKDFFYLDTPGPTTAFMRNVKFANVERPYFPADRDFSEFLPTILHK